MISERFYFQDL